MDVDLNLPLSKRGGSNRKRKKRRSLTIILSDTRGQRVSVYVYLAGTKLAVGEEVMERRESERDHVTFERAICGFLPLALFLFPSPLALSFSFCDGPFFFFFFLKNIVGFACQSRPNEKAYCHMGWKEASRQTDKLYGLHTCYALSTTAQEDAKKNNKPQRGGSTRVIRPVASHHNHKEKGESSMFEINIENREI